MSPNAEHPPSDQTFTGRPSSLTPGEGLMCVKRGPNPRNLLLYLNLLISLELPKEKENTGKGGHGCEMKEVRAVTDWKVQSLWEGETGRAGREDEDEGHIDEKGHKNVGQRALGRKTCYG